MYLPQVNVWCLLLHDDVAGVHIFAEQIIKGSICLDILEVVTFPQTENFYSEMNPQFFPTGRGSI